MNERMREISEQAWNFVSDTRMQLQVGTFGDAFEKKFAELIVRECAEVGLDSVEDGDDLDAIMKRVHDNILKHFGVEE